MSRYNMNTRVIDLTLGELLDAIEERMQRSQQTTVEPAGDKNYVYGLKGFAKLLGCSKTTAVRLKASGDFDEAITQVGALLIIDADKVMQIAKNRKKH
jgi:hypothetical protein